MRVRDEAAQLAGEVAELRHSIHREPEIGLDLPKTQAKVLAALDGLPLEISTGRELSSVTAVLRGGGPGPVVLLRGDMDALPVTELTRLPYASQVPGAMHACGHDLHTAMLAGAAELLSARQAELPGTVIFMFQPGEEGYAGARYMINEGVLDAAGPRPVAAYALHVTSNELPCGMFSTRPGPMLAAADQITVTVHGRGGHASQPHRAADPIPAACEMVHALQTLVTRKFDVFDPVVITVGSFHAGTTDNVIPDQASVPGHRPVLQPQVPQRPGRAGAAADRGHRPGARPDRRGRIRREYPVTVNDAAEAEFAGETITDVFGPGAGGQRAEFPLTGAEDFSYVLEQVPGAFVLLGACPPGPTRRPRRPTTPRGAVFDDAALADGTALYAELALRRLAPELPGPRPVTHRDRCGEPGRSELEAGDVGLLGADGFGGGAQAGEFGLGEVALDHTADAGRADLGLHAQVDAGDPVLAVHPGAHRQDRARVLGHGAGHPGRGGGRGVVGRAGLQQRDDLAAAVPGPGDQRLDLVGGQQVGQRPAVHRAGRGHRHHGVAVRAQRQGAHRADRDAQLLGHEVAEPGGVEHARPGPCTRCDGKPDTLAASAVISSSGLDTTISTASGAYLATFSTTLRTILALTSIRSIRLMPGLRGSPAVTTTMPTPAITS